MDDTPINHSFHIAGLTDPDAQRAYAHKRAKGGERTLLHHHKYAEPCTQETKCEMIQGAKTDAS